MSPPAHPFVALSLALLVAGCLNLAPGVEVPDDGLPSPLDPVIAKHDHWDPAEHRFAANVSLLDWQPVAKPKESPGAHSVHVHGDLLAVGTDGPGYEGFVLYDVSVPEKPREISRFLEPSLDAGDRTVMFSADGKTIFACAEGPTTGAAQGRRVGIVAVDVSDPVNPKEAAFVPIPPSGAHTLYPYEEDGVQYVYATGGYGIRIFRYDASEPAFTLVGAYVAATPDNLVTRNPYFGDPAHANDNAGYVRRDIYGHDMFVRRDEASARTILYAAYSYDGFKIVDVTDPSQPREISTWNPTDEHAPWYVHTAWVEEIAGRIVAIVGTETFETRHDEAPGPVWAIDVTDAASPKLLATWANPGGHGAANLMFSPHSLRSIDGVLYLSHYHAGVWIVDVRSVVEGKTTTAAVLGYYLPHNDNGFRREGAPERTDITMDGVPLTMDVEVHKGVIYAADRHSGLYALRYTGTLPGA